MSVPSTIAHYRIVSKLGEGGMGEVWRATDTKLGRDVAIKILPEALATDPDRMARFRREAQLLASLNHPHIVTVYDVSSADGVDYMAMELVSGRTIGDLLTRRRLKVPETLKYAVQIADALAGAHAAGIVHRDLKPGNIMVTDNGAVKTLDFGLAKLTGPEEESEDEATRTAGAVTEAGTVVGSAAYMSPEQAEGKKVDARSDIFSFGLLLYEMLSGKRAFGGETRMATMAAVLNREPEPLGKVAPGVPKELERIVTRCLRKDVTRRSQSMAEIKIALEDLKEESETGASASVAVAQKPARLWRWWVLGGAAAALGMLFFLQSPEPRAAWTEVPLASYNGYQGEPTLSPDGSQFGFVWDGGHENAPAQLYVSLVGRGTPLRLTNTPGVAVRNPAWSPDGQMIAAVRQVPEKPDDLIVIPALGGPEHRIDEASSLSRPAWSPDAKWLYFSANVSPQTLALFVAPSSGGEKRQLTDPPVPFADTAPSVSPDGKRLLFIRSSGDYSQDLMIAELRDGTSAGAPRRLTNDHRNKYSPVWTNDGKDIVYIGGENFSLLAIYRVPASGGSSTRIEGMGGDYPTSLATAPKGHRLAYSRGLRDYNIYRMAMASSGAAGAPTKFLSSTRFEEFSSYSPDGKRVAFSSNRGGVRQIWVADADGSNPIALTNFSGGVAGSPKWSPDSRTLVFDARPERLADVYSINADGGTPKRLTDNPAEDHVPYYSADGRWIYFASTRSGQRQLYRMPAEGGEAVQITRNGAFVSIASPDGKWVYYGKSGAGLWRVPPDGGEETRVAAIPNLYTVFSFCVTATGIYYAGAINPATKGIPLKLYRFADGKTVQLGHLDKPLRLHISVSPDEKWLTWTQLDNSVDEVMLVENFQ